MRLLEDLGLTDQYAAIADFSDAAVGDAKNVYFDWRRYDTGERIGRVSPVLQAKNTLAEYCCRL